MISGSEKDVFRAAIITAPITGSPVYPGLGLFMVLGVYLQEEKPLWPRGLRLLSPLGTLDQCSRTNKQTWRHIWAIFHGPHPLLPP